MPLQNDLNHFNTGHCLVCASRLVRGFHHEQYCPNEDQHNKVEGKKTVYVLLPKHLCYVSGEVVNAGIRFETEANAMSIRGAFQLWTATEVSRIEVRLGKFIKFTRPTKP